MLSPKRGIDIIFPVFNLIHFAKLFTVLAKDVATKFRILICYDHYSDKTSNSFNKSYFNFQSLKIKNKYLIPHGAIVTCFEEYKPKAFIFYLREIIFE